LIGMVMLMLSAIYLQPVMRRLFGEVFNYWDAVLG
jgi:hypothetical protein